MNMSSTNLSPEVETASSNATYKKPKTRQRIHKIPRALSVPDINDDSAERKRVLNVLAQRRYRERRKQGKGHVTSATESTQYDSPPKTQPGNQASHQSSTLEDGTNRSDELLLQEDFGPGLSTDAILLGGTENLDLNLQSWSSSALDSTFLDITEATDQGQLDFGSGDATFMMPQTPYSLSGITSTPTSLASPSSLTGATNNSTSSSSSTLMITTTNDFLSSLWSTTTTSSSSPSSSSHKHKHKKNSDSNEEAEFTFPDSYLLPMAELALFRAFTRIARRLGCGDGAMWSLDARSPFVLGAGGGGGGGALLPSAAAHPHPHLPAHLRPTPAQSTVPHHPVLDFLPWPVVRDRLITVLSMPDEARPPVAGGTAAAAAVSGGGGGGGGGGVAMALVQFAYDMEHTAEGIRIWGPDIYDPRAWEVGQVLFEKWWFIFDREVVEQSNYWRRMRGVKELFVRGPSAGAV